MPLTALPGAATTVLYAGTMGDGVYVRQGDAAWRPLGHGLTGEDNTILAVVVASGPGGFPAHPTGRHRTWGFPVPPGSLTRRRPSATRHQHERIRSTLHGTEIEWSLRRSPTA